MSTSSPFLDLPVELRTWIYEAHFEAERLVDVPAFWDETLESFGHWKNQQPALTRTNRQIREESLSAFYAYCTFSPWRVCSPCIPDDLHRTHIAEDSPPDAVPPSSQPRPRSDTCRCIVHKCDGECISVYGRDNPWRWLAAIGEHNLRRIRTLELSVPDDVGIGQIGYNVVVQQNSTSKELTIRETSHWQEDFDARKPARKILGSEPKGRAIIDEIHRALLAVDADGAASAGLTIARIHTILDISYKRSFVHRRNFRDFLRIPTLLPRQPSVTTTTTTTGLPATVRDSPS